MAVISVGIDERELNPFQNQEIEKALVRAVRKAGGDAIRAVRADGKRRVRVRKRIKSQFLHDRAMPLTFPRGQTLEAQVWQMAVTGKEIPLGRYPSRQTKRGVSVQVNKGRRKLIEGAFIATMHTGHVGVFMREGASRLPIKHALSSRVSDVFQDKGMAPDVLLRGHTVFGRTFRRVLPLELAKAQG